MTKITVRVTRTYDVDVEAAYGDDDAALVTKALASLEESPPDPAELCTVLDARFDSRYTTLDEHNEAPEVIAAEEAEDEA